MRFGITNNATTVRDLQSQNEIRCCAMATIVVVEKHNILSSVIVTVDKILWWHSRDSGVAGRSLEGLVGIWRHLIQDSFYFTTWTQHEDFYDCEIDETSVSLHHRYHGTVYRITLSNRRKVSTTTAKTGVSTGVLELRVVALKNRFLSCEKPLVHIIRGLILPLWHRHKTSWQ
jgi:hypothetical protein